MEFVSPRVAAVIIVVCVVALAAAPRSAVQESRASAAAASELEILRIRPNFYMIAGADANIALQVGVDGVVLVDTGSRNNVNDVMSVVRKITSAPIRFIVNTSADADLDERLSGLADKADADCSAVHCRVRGDHGSGRGSSLPLGQEARGVHERDDG